jgi:hypothetical protein
VWLVGSSRVLSRGRRTARSPLSSAAIARAIGALCSDLRQAVAMLPSPRSLRFAKDFENLAETLATFVILASIQFALRRHARA